MASPLSRPRLFWNLFFILVAALLPCRAALSAIASATAEVPSDGTKAGLAGSWHFDPARSTELSPWQSCDLVISVTGTQVTLSRQLGSGRRGFSDTMTIDTARPATVVPVAMWPDNRHLGAYIGGDQTKRVHAEWLDAGRILRLSTDLVLATQQGDRAVNILSDYKVSANGTQLTLTELRSTRNRPVVYVFTRVVQTKQ